MKVTLDVRNRDEGDAIRSALDDPKTKTFVVISGLLQQLPDDADRALVLRIINEMQGIPAYLSVGNPASSAQVRPQVQRKFDARSTQVQDGFAFDRSHVVLSDDPKSFRLHDGDRDTGE
jgi:O-methyltransferase involved in polyketide biosynthesis